ncbi:UDP-N-acetylglucosamine 2-epimerase [Oxobacter pfennigii]|uniref:UDP-N-acetylglucosamine 2-epimerase (non-hydrolyzing) n=1 Tax=Oxobacter pfennigii TaxID=36849 RepID=A0A0P8X1C8_9CLOT|nr:UDP-N-acetylglucosamine 2-epimerase (non-hydrolyzing) [Oxobacter pfennigii]KPU44621.1 UDP-N-acetylglucosamine 2-epimerase [Oxobacter pfennigii]
MHSLKIMTIFGTRPEAIKMAPLIKELKKSPNINIIVCVTAQHREMLDMVLDLFDIIPEYDLDIMKERQTLSGITTKVILGLEGILKTEKPDLILVHGDTTTTFASSLAAFYNDIKVGHVEAGLRTHNKYFPYPEEMNRKLTAQLSDIHFAPTLKAKENLLKEGIDEKCIYVTGNTVIDAMEETVDKSYIFKSHELKKIDFKNKRIIFVTAHRRENWGQPLFNICTALKSIAQKYPDIEVVYLVHLNPVVTETANNILRDVPRVHLLPPLDIKETHNLMDRAYLVLTDSGGLQEEAPHLGKPVLVLRDVTERPEAEMAGTLKVIGTDIDRIVNETSFLLDDKELYSKMANAVNPFGDGRASLRIRKGILHYFKYEEQKPEEFAAEI